MGERLKPAVLKTAVLERVPGVRIPLPPPDCYANNEARTPIVGGLARICCQIYTPIMKRVPVWLLLLAATATAQTLPEHRVVDRLSDDLVALASLPAMPEGRVVVNPLQLDPNDRAALKTAVKGQTPALDGIMLRFAAHAAERYDKYVVTWSLAYVLPAPWLAGDCQRDRRNASQRPSCPHWTARLSAVRPQRHHETPRNSALPRRPLMTPCLQLASALPTRTSSSRTCFCWGTDCPSSPFADSTAVMQSLFISESAVQAPHTRPIALPPKSVSFSCRPLCRYHNLLCSSPNRCKIVAWNSRME
jgi:hypothetical protein